MLCSESALNLVRHGHLVKCRVEPASDHSNCYHLVLIAKDGQGGEESFLEDGSRRKALFASKSDARFKAVKLGFNDNQIELPE